MRTGQKIVRSVTLNIKQDDIEKGIPGVFNECPVARILLQKGFTNIDVDSDRILATYKGKRLVYKTPVYMSLFIESFDGDSSGPVKPSKFKLEKPRLATIDDERKPLYTDHNKVEYSHE